MDLKVLRLPKDKNRVNKLRKKLKEYAEEVGKVKTRLEKENLGLRPELIQPILHKSPIYIGFAILSELFLEKEVYTDKFSLELNKELGGLNTNNYNIACAVINYHCKTDGVNSQRRTDLR